MKLLTNFIYQKPHWEICNKYLVTSNRDLANAYVSYFKQWGVKMFLLKLWLDLQIWLKNP